jgi:hypothetical protein
MTDAAPKMVVTSGLIFTLAVNLAVPFTVRKVYPKEVAYIIETIHCKVHHFDVGSLSGGVQWVQAGQVRIHAT